MDNVIEVFYVCQVLPLVLSLIFLSKNARFIMSYVFLGSAICLVSSMLDRYVLSTFNISLYYDYITVCPIMEEILKTLPVLFFAFFVSDDRTTLMRIAFALGIGFAIFDNVLYWATQNTDVGFVMALIRGLSSGLMQGLCTVTVGLGLSFVRKRKKLFVCGTIALLMMSVCFHATYNIIDGSKYWYCASLLPITIFVPTIRVIRTHSGKEFFSLKGRSIFRKMKKSGGV